MVGRARQPGGGDQPLDRRDRDRSARREHDLHRHGGRASRLVVGQRRPPHAAGRAGARRLQVHQRRRELHARGATSASARRRRTRPAPRPATTGSRAGSRGSSSTPTTRTPSTPACSATASGARPTPARLDAGLPHRQPERLPTDNPVGDTFGDRTEFDLVDLGATTRAYLGDASDDFALDGDDSTPLPQVFRNDDVAAIAGVAGRRPTTTPAGPSSRARRTARTGFPAYGWCQNGQCGYDYFVVQPARASERGVARGLDELRRAAGLRGPAAALQRPCGDPLDQRERHAPRPTTWQDMTAVLSSDDAWDVTSGLHPDQHGDRLLGRRHDGVRRLRRRRRPRRRDRPGRRSGSCANRRYVYDGDAGPVPLNADDLADCEMLLIGHPGRHQRRSTTGSTRCSSSRCRSTRRTRRTTCSAARRTTAPGRSPARRPGSRASAATAGSRASTPATRPSATTTTSTPRRR